VSDQAAWGRAGQAGSGVGASDGVGGMGFPRCTMIPAGAGDWSGTVGRLFA